MYKNHFMLCWTPYFMWYYCNANYVGHTCMHLIFDKNVARVFHIFVCVCMLCGALFSERFFNLSLTRFTEQFTSYSGSVLKTKCKLTSKSKWDILWPLFLSGKPFLGYIVNNRSENKNKKLRTRMILIIFSLRYKL